MAKPTAAQIAACKKWNMSDEEIQKMYADDAETDKGIVHEWDLSPQEHKAAMKYANVDEHKKPAEPVKRERKANDTKALIIAEIAQFLQENEQISPENVEITNAERVISMKIGENTYEITLSQKRKKKN